MLLCLIISILSINAYVYATESVLVGDVNGDGKVTIRDATYLQMNLSKINGYMNLTDKQILSADINSDGEVNILDVTLIQKFRVGIDTQSKINQYIEYTEPTTEPTTDGQWLPGFFD